jgi:hypothetical protein
MAEPCSAANEKDRPLSSYPAVNSYRARSPQEKYRSMNPLRNFPAGS